MGEGGEITQTLYAHMNKRNDKKGIPSIRKADIAEG
jgi:hypothetical protein